MKIGELSLKNVTLSIFNFDYSFIISENVLNISKLFLSMYVLLVLPQKTMRTKLICSENFKLEIFNYIIDSKV